MDYKSKYLKYKNKYLELKKQIGDDDNIYIELWKIKDSKEFDDNKDGKVSKYEYQKNIHKYFNFEAIDFKNLDKQEYESKINTIFQFSDENKDNLLSDNEVVSLSKIIRDKEELIINSKDELKSQEYTALKKIMGMEHICPLGKTDRKFKGTEKYSKMDTEKILKMFLRMRYLVEVKGKLEYITLDNRTKYEEEIFNLVCNNKDKCKFHNLQISDFESSTIDEYLEILEIIKKYEDPNNDGSLVVHCGAGSGRTGTIFMIYIWFTDYINNTNNCVDETNKILETLNRLNKVLQNSKEILNKELEDSKNKVKQRYHDKIDNLSKINSEKLYTLFRKRNSYLPDFKNDESLLDNLEDLFDNLYLKELYKKLENNYIESAAKELFDSSGLEEETLFYIRLYRMIKAIKQI